VRLRDQRRFLGVCTLRFVALGRELRAEAGQRLLEVCEEAGIPMEAACGGFAACNTCRVRVIRGQLSELREEEEPFLDLPSQRLACQAFLVGDLELDLDPGS
jgi:ferredoxin